MFKVEVLKMKWNLFVKRILTCALAAATIATSVPAYTYAAEAEDEVIVVEEDNDEITQDVEETTDADDGFLGENDCTIRIVWDRGASVTITEPASIAGEVKAGADKTVEKGTTVKFKVVPGHQKTGKYKVLSVKAGDTILTAGSDGVYSVTVEDTTEVRIDIEQRLKITFEQPDNVGKIGCTPIKEKDNDVFDEIADWPGYIYLKPNADIRWLYRPDKGYSITKVVKVEGDREIELKPVAKPKNEGEVGIYELKNVTEEVTIRRYSKKDEEEPTFDHKLTLSNESDYNSVVINGKNLLKGESVGFNDGDSILITGLGKGDSIDTKNWSTYFVKWTYKGNKESGYEYGDGYKDDKIGGLFALNNLTEDIELTVQGRQIPVSAITAKGKTEGSYTVTATAASKKGDYINLTKHKADTKVTFATKKTGSINYEIASDAAGVKYGIAEVEPVSLTKEKNGYCFEIPFGTLAGLAYSENPKVEFTTAVAAKLPAPTAKVSTSTDIDATLTLGLPTAASGLTGLWYKVEGKANVAKGKSLPEGMAGEVGPLYVPATVTTLPVYLMAEEGKQYGDGTAQKYDFTATLLQLKNEPEYSGESITDKSAVEGADGGNVAGVSTAKKVSGSTKKPGYEEKLGLTKKKVSFIRGEGGDDGILLATAKYSKNTTFRSLSYAKITNAAGEIVKSSDTDDDFKRIILDGDNIILEDTNDLAPGKYTLSVLPVSRIGSQPKAATLALTVKQGIDKIDIWAVVDTHVAEQVIKKSGKSLTIKSMITYNDGDKAKTPAIKKVKWEITDAEGNAISQSSPLYGKISINKKNGTVTVAKDLVIPKDPGSYSFVIVATAEDYEGNIACATAPFELVSDQFPPVELEISIDDKTGEGRVKASDLKFSKGVIKGSDGKLYVNGDIWLFKINTEKKYCPCIVHIEGEEQEYGCGYENRGKGVHDLNSNLPIRAIKLGKKINMVVHVQ